MCSHYELPFLCASLKYASLGDCNDFLITPRKGGGRRATGEGIILRTTGVVKLTTSSSNSLLLVFHPIPLPKSAHDVPPVEKHLVQSVSLSASMSGNSRLQPLALSGDCGVLRWHGNCMYQCSEVSAEFPRAQQSVP